MLVVSLVVKLSQPSSEVLRGLKVVFLVRQWLDTDDNA